MPFRGVRAPSLSFHSVHAHAPGACLALGGRVGLRPLPLTAGRDAPLCEAGRSAPSCGVRLHHRRTSDKLGRLMLYILWNSLEIFGILWNSLEIFGNLKEYFGRDWKEFQTL